MAEADSTVEVDIDDGIITVRFMEPASNYGRNPANRMVFDI